MYQKRRRTNSRYGTGLTVSQEVNLYEISQLSSHYQENEIVKLPLIYIIYIYYIYIIYILYIYYIYIIYILYIYYIPGSSFGRVKQSNKLRGC